MRTIIITLLFWCVQAQAEDGWVCESEQAFRQGNAFYACGMAESTSEPFARQRALVAAITEFNTVCEISSDCAGKERTAEPKRMTCYHDKSGLVRCYRLVVFTIR